MTARIEIDLNVRVRGGLTYAGFEDASGAVAAGDHVRVYERESGLEGPGEVVEVDAATKLIYLRVEWSELSAPWRADDQPFRLPALIGGPPVERDAQDRRERDRPGSSVDAAHPLQRGRPAPPGRIRA